MSVQTQIDRIQQNVTDTYSALEEMGATMPSEQNSDNMAATVLTVPRGGGGDSVQSDWNQTDETAADFIKNKPFGDGIVEIMPETELVGTENNGMYEIDIDCTIFSGEESQLIITFDGVEYTCNAIDPGDDSRFFGNTKYLGGDDTGEPFILLVVSVFNMAILAMQDGEPHTVSIATFTAVKMDKKYIDVATAFYTNGDDAEDVYLYTDLELTTKATLSELRIASSKCFVVRLVVDGFICTATYYPTIIEHDPLSEYGVVVVRFSGEDLTYYTAEYTG